MDTDQVPATRVIAISVLFLFALLVLPAVASAQTATEPDTVIGSPEIEVVATADRLDPGETQTVEIQVTNSGDIRRAGASDLEQRVTTARNLRFSVDERRLPDEIELRSGPVVAGSLPEGVGEPIRFTFDVSEDIDIGTHEIPVKVEYDFTRLAERTAAGRTEYRDFSRERTERIEYIVEDDARFSVDAVSSAVVAGDTGDYVVQVENTGTRTARSPRMVFSSDESGVFFGGLDDRLPQKTVGFDDLEPGETATVTTRAGADSDVTAASYPIDTFVRYETDRGVTRESGTSTAILAVDDEQDFVTENVTSSLRVGDDGDLHGEIRNNGPQAVTNAVVVFAPENRNINPRETEYAVGDLGVGDSAEFRYRVAVSSEAEEGPRQTDAVVEYRNPDGDKRTSSPADVNYDVAERTDEFDLETDVSLAAGSSTDIEVEVTNIKDETFTDVQAKMFTDSPLDSDDDEAFIPSLEPGESETIVFDLSASGGATAKTYSASVDFRYDDERDETKISQTYRVPVDVTESEEGGVPWLPIAVVLVVAGAGWWYRDVITGKVSDARE